MPKKGGYKDQSGVDPKSAAFGGRKGGGKNPCKAAGKKY